nr:unnamed protein product [Trichobilharzia regenti]
MSRIDYPILTAILYVVFAIIDVTVIALLIIYDRIRKRFPLNFVLALLYSACLTVVAEPSFIGRNIIWVLVVMAIGVVLYIICISIGATLRSELKLGSLGMLIGYVVFSVIITAATLAVYFSTKN